MGLKLKFWEGNKINWKKIGGFVVLIVLFGVISFFIIKKLEPYLGEWKQYGYWGVFLSAFVANATIVLPAPFMSLTIPFAVSFATQTDLFSVATVYALGATLGEGVGYVAGRLGKRILDKNGNSLYQKAEKWLKRHGKWAIIVLSLQPIFPFDLVGIAAGTLKYPWWKFLLFCFVGRLPKYLILLGGVFELWKLVVGLFD